MKIRVITLIEIVTIIICVPLLGNFTISRVFNLNIEWAYEIFLVISSLFSAEVIRKSSGKYLVWGQLTNIWSKTIVTLSLTIFFTFIFYPASQGINDIGASFLFFILGFCVTSPIWLLLKVILDKQTDGQDNKI